MNRLQECECQVFVYVRVLKLTDEIAVCSRSDLPRAHGDFMRPFATGPDEIGCWACVEVLVQIGPMVRLVGSGPLAAPERSFGMKQKRKLESERVKACRAFSDIPIVD